MIYFIFSKEAKKLFLRFPQEIQKRILLKLKILKNHSNIFSILSKITKFKMPIHRLKIGNYRLIMSIKSQGKKDLYFLILDLGQMKKN